MADLTVERARKLLEYDPSTGASTGAFTWRESAAQCITPGTPAGGLTGEGYVRVRLGGRIYPAHRLAWFITHGVWPEGEIDHINGVRHDNRLCNLRCLTKAQNAQNRVKPSAINKSGVSGVHWFARAARFQAEKQFLTHAPNRAAIF